VLGKSGVKLADIGVVQTGPRYAGFKIIETHDSWYSAPIQEGILLGMHE
jgi:hypothetical protein